MLHVHTGLKIRHEQKLEEIQSSVGLFKTNDHLKYMYKVPKKTISAPCSSIFNGWISSGGALTSFDCLLLFNQSIKIDRE